MQGKMKSFFEDTGIILVLAATIYGGYYTYTTFSGEIPNLFNTKESNEEIIIVKKEPLVNDNKSVQIKEIISEETVEKIETEQVESIEKKVQKQESTKVFASPTLEGEELKKKESKKQEVVKVSVPLLIEKLEVKKEKNVDLAMLRIFLRNIKFLMASNIVKRDDIEVTVPQELKIRVTVLPNGSYEELIFVSGDEKLFEMNKENIVKVFPARIDDKIKDDFPRYIRISIK